MKQLIRILCLLAILFEGALPLAAQSNSGYVVQPGDTLTSIARRYGIGLDQLVTANGLTGQSWVYVGQQLVIPGESVPAPDTKGTYYNVRSGDTLLTIAIRHRITVSQLAAANGLAWNAWVYVGQRLRIPGATGTTPETTLTPAATTTPTPTPATTPTPVEPGGVYIVRAGDNLFRIALRHGVTVPALKAANALVSDIVYIGQRLTIPGADSGTPANPSPKPPPINPGVSGEKWIDVNLSTQTITAYAGQTPVYSALVSTGLWGTPTVVGTFQIYVKYLSTPMSGPGYYLPNVPHTMYFYRGYAIHGAYWHNNFGTPMSHGCVNLSLPDAEWFYNWAPVGTKVVTHY
ncbi:MAG: LysM peptidoglycan-binding domain-containing protein [Anaerolineae bacterium]|nr:LysM peptidoglycan-binding domain-containing protein [Anaerolineae bacterium]